MRATPMFTVLFGACLAAQAHDLYLMPNSFQVPVGGEVMFSIYNGDAFPQATSRVYLDRLQNPKLHSRGAAPTLPAFAMDGTSRAFSSVRTSTPSDLILTVQTAARTESMTGGEFLDYLREENLASVISQREKAGEAAKEARERYSKFAKTIVRIGEGDGYYSTAVGLLVEFVPEKDPWGLKKGDVLPVRLLFRGRPAAGVQVTAWQASGTTTAEIAPLAVTDADGRVSIPIEGPAQWRLHAIVMERTTDSTADWESFWATLTFVSK